MLLPWIIKSDLEIPWPTFSSVDIIHKSEPGWTHFPPEYMYKRVGTTVISQQNVGTLLWPKVESYGQEAAKKQVTYAYYHACLGKKVNLLLFTTYLDARTKSSLIWAWEVKYEFPATLYSQLSCIERTPMPNDNTSILYMCG